MFGNDCPTIGVLIADMTSFYQQQLCETLSSEAKKLGYNLAFFTCFTVYGNKSKNSKGEYNIINLPPYENFDAILYCLDTFSSERTVAELNRLLKSRARCPVICIRRYIEEFYSVSIDDSTAIGKMVQHLIDTHNARRIAFMTGPKEHPDSIARFNSYKEILELNDIPFNEDLIFEGDFWKNKAADAAIYFMETLEERPDAIVCANDYMAISLSNALIMRGYMVPDDVTITGFDNIPDSRHNMPPITTISVPVEDMAKKAISMVHSILNDMDIEKHQFIETRDIIRNSCGCNIFDMRDMILTRVTQANETDQVYNQMLNNTFIAIALQDLTSCESIGSYLHLLDYNDNNVRNFFLCLGEGRGELYPKYRSNRPTFPKRSHSVYGFVNRKELITKSFDTTMLIPAEAETEEPQSYYFTPLHYQDYTFGYVAMSYYNFASCDKAFQSWIANISNALENLRVTNESNRLLSELNNLYVHDALTGLYNRRGFERLAGEQFAQAMKTKNSVMVLGLDMDNLKTVNDQFGHAHGDIALKEIAQAMCYAATKGEICARVGGDEFNVFGTNYTQEDIDRYVERFYAYLEEYNQNSPYDYIVTASFGSSLASRTDKMTFEDCINLSDTRLYEQKREKKGRKQ